MRIDLLASASRIAEEDAMIARSALDFFRAKYLHDRIGFCIVREIPS
jgi:hypothetical protein